MTMGPLACTPRYSCTRGPLPHRGTYRTSPAKWLAPEAVKPPPGSSRSAGTGRVTSALARAGNRCEALLEVPAQLAPLSLAFQLQAGGAGREELSAAGRNFAVPVGMSPGRVAPMGEGGCRPAVLPEAEHLPQRFCTCSSVPLAKPCVTRNGLVSPLSPWTLAGTAWPGAAHVRQGAQACMRARLQGRPC